MTQIGASVRPIYNANDDVHNDANVCDIIIAVCDVMTQMFVCNECWQYVMVVT